MRIVLLVSLALLAIPSAAAADPFYGRYSGSFSFDREVNKQIDDGSSTKRLIRSDHWTVTLGERIDTVAYPPNYSAARYNATISGSVTLQYSESFFGDPAQTASGGWSGSGQVQVEINERDEQDGVRLSELSIIGDNFSGTMGLPGSWTDTDETTYTDPLIPMMDAVIAPDEPLARETESDSENSWSSFRVLDDDWPTTDTALLLQLVYTPPDPLPLPPPLAAFGIAHTKHLNRIEFHPTGSSAVPGSTCRWSFGDGDTWVGNAASHRYPRSRTYTATLTITQPDGQSATAVHTVAVPTWVIAETVCGKVQERQVQRP